MLTHSGAEIFLRVPVLKLVNLQTVSLCTVLIVILMSGTFSDTLNETEVILMEQYTEDLWGKKQ